MFVNFIDNNEHYWLKSGWSLDSKVYIMITRNEITGFGASAEIGCGGLWYYSHFKKQNKQLSGYPIYHSTNSMCKQNSAYVVLFMHKVTKSAFFYMVSQFD